ncbi:hypothetical protein QFZ40_002179 [Arthrobacter pascens]|uniref:hypothetical protein n=1 Tax=Arthrobacter pascens TaxID=1677 RepID=UPI0027803040|nr:hypothetical protein [Arthrobacter pascens]
MRKFDFVQVDIHVDAEPDVHSPLQQLMGEVSEGVLGLGDAHAVAGVMVVRVASIGGFYPGPPAITEMKDREVLRQWGWGPGH